MLSHMSSCLCYVLTNLPNHLLVLCKSDHVGRDQSLLCVALGGFFIDFVLIVRQFFVGCSYLLLMCFYFFVLCLNNLLALIHNCLLPFNTCGQICYGSHCLLHCSLHIL